jgi:hypothetical protein
MAKQFTVKILPSEDFEKLPFKRIRENPGSVFGAADHKTGIAFVRDTGFDDFTKANIEHELDELMAMTSPHEEDGIRYKDFSQSFGNFASNIPVIGRVAKPILGAVGGGIDLLGKGAGALGLPNFNIGNASAPSGFTSPVPGPGGRQIVGTAQAPTPPALPASGQAPSFLSNVFSGFKNAGSAFLEGVGNRPPLSQQSTTGATGPSVPGPQGNFLEDIFNTVGKASPALAVSAIGELFAPKPDRVDVSGVTDELRNRISGDALSPLFQQGAGEINRVLDADIDAPPESAFVRGDQLIAQQTADDIKALEQQFQALNPGANVANNSAFLAEKARIEESSRERRAAVRDEISFTFEREQLQRRLQATQIALNLDSAQTAQLIQIAQADLEAIGINLGLDAQDARDFKSLFSQFGQLLVQDRNFSGNQTV